MNLKKGSAVNNRGQIWVETVIYTLIAFSLMGLVLAFVIPKIQEIQDKGITEQSKKVLNDMDSLIKEIRGSPGNQRILELGMNKGSLTFDAANDKIFFELESKYQYSQPGENVSEGSIIVNTQEKSSINLLTLTLNYTGESNLTYSGQEISKTITKAPIPYKILIADTGKDSSGNPLINIEVIE
jgi:type II secretory pathway pseudopilin PulG